MKKYVCGAMILVLVFLSLSCALAAYTKEDIPASSDETFEPYEITDSNGLHCIITGIRFDLDDENMPVIVVKYTLENTTERSKGVNGCYWIETTDSFNTGSGSLLQGVGNHYKNYVHPRPMPELKPGESITLEDAYQIDNFTDNIYIFFFANDKERRIYNPQDINNYTVSYRK